MGKRSTFKRNPRDFYPTPAEAVAPLLAHIRPGLAFAEPCAGDGALVRHLQGHGLRCYWQSDIEPQADGIFKADALTLTNPLAWPDYIITNPPWSRDLLHPMIEHFRKLAPTWLLLDAGWKYTRQSEPFMRYCHDIIAVGRVKWIPGTKMTGKDDAVWMLFKSEENAGSARFYGRSTIKGTSSYVSGIDTITTLA